MVVASLKETIGALDFNKCCWFNTWLQTAETRWKLTPSMAYTVRCSTTCACCCSAMPAVTLVYIYIYIIYMSYAHKTRTGWGRIPKHRPRYFISNSGYIFSATTLCYVCPSHQHTLVTWHTEPRTARCSSETVVPNPWNGWSTPGYNKQHHL